MATVNHMHTPGERVAIVAGLRTPFARQLTAYKDLNAIELASRSPPNCSAASTSIPL